MPKKSNFVFVVLLLTSVSSLFAKEPDCCRRQFLFHIERTRDADQVYYDVNINKDGSLNRERPVNVYWVKYTQDGGQESLTWMQRRYAYGLKILERGGDKMVFQFVSYDQLSFVIKPDLNGRFKVYLAGSDQDLQVKNIRVYFEPGTMIIPSVEKVELTMMRDRTGELMVQAIHP